MKDAPSAVASLLYKFLICAEVQRTIPAFLQSGQVQVNIHGYQRCLYRVSA